MSRILVIIFLIVPILVIGQEKRTTKSNSLKDDIYLHPMDNITPYSLRKGEKIYAQSIQTLPFPSWAFVGITDRLTAQIDLLPWIYGFFSEFRKPIPSLNFRYQFNKQEGIIPTIGIETMFVHFWGDLERFDTPTLQVTESGSYFHIKPVIGYKIKNWSLNASLGLDYIGSLSMKNVSDNSTPIYESKNSWNPNASIGIGYRKSHWISYHLGYTYGSTLTYLENVPRKHQITYGFRIAPFYKNRFGILRHLRIELVAINAGFPDINARQDFPIPIFPYFYWQWEKRPSKQKQQK